MNNTGADRRSPLGPLPSEPTSRLYDHEVEVLRTGHYRRRTEQVYSTGFAASSAFAAVCRIVTTSGRCKNFWGTRTSRPRWSIRMGRTAAGRVCTVPSTAWEGCTRSRAGALCGPRRQHKILEAGCPPLELVTEQAVTVATRQCRLLVTPTGTGFEYVGLNKR
jgi:hypothetical protein